MRRWDWIVLACLIGAALWAGWPTLRQTPFLRFLSGECEWRGRSGCPAPPASGAPPPMERGGR